MALPFSETTRSLNADGFRGAIGTLVCVALVGGAWLVWLVAGSVATWEISSVANLEVSGKAFGVDLDQSGQVVAVPVRVGSEVAVGDPLLVLDRRDLELALEAARAETAQLAQERVVLKAQAGEEQEALARAVAEAQAAVAQAQAAVAAAGEQLKLQEDRAGRYTTLRKEQMISELEHMDIRADLERAKGNHDGARLGWEGAKRRQEMATQALAVAEAELAERLGELDAKVASNTARLKELALDLEKRTVRAPVAGTVGELAQVQAGGFVAAGFRLCTLVPRGEMRVVAQYAPSAALGRIQPGQEARVRMSGFPWTEYGLLKAKVLAVGSEPRDGLIQVDLALLGGSDRIPLQHGQPGTVEVEIGRASPWSLLLRAVGLRLSGSGVADGSKG